MIKLSAQTGPAVALLVLTACQRQPAGPSTGKRSPVAVQVSTVANSDVPSIYSASGTVRAKITSPLSSKVMGTVRSVNVRAGDRVSAGEVLVVLDAQDLDAQFRSAEATQQGARASVAAADSEVASAKSNLELAEATFQRMKTLYDQRSLSNQEFDEANAKVKAARANYQMAQAKRQQGESAIAQSAAGLSAAGVNRSYARILAPFAGTVTDRNVEAGSLAVPGNPLLTIERQGSYRLEATVDESHLSAIHAGEKVDVNVDGIDRPLEGVVSEISPTADAATRTYTVKLDLPGKPLLHSGVFGRANFRTGANKAVMIPAGAVTTNGQLESVMVAEADTAHLRIITTGMRDGKSVAVLSGLQPGDKLIYPVPSGLVDGSPVEVRQ